ncbi:hypothetical protein FK481_0069 [Listeria phage LP-010]|uniref:Uncharacterized protein n=2 Tax=Homburgvirus LP114 TaxID=1921129 RepID=A0A514U6K7_9CAUD|nr:hypothetical protein FK481_0069 [Listeria phage LP-010]QDK04692.1 hypothetical protein FK482_0070 [Listeria phage LP-013]
MNNEEVENGFTEYMQGKGKFVKDKMEDVYKSGGKLSRKNDDIQEFLDKYDREWEELNNPE